MKSGNLKATIFRVSISFVCLIWVFSGVDFGNLKTNLGSFPLSHVLAVLILASSSLFAPSLRLFVLSDFKSGFMGALEAHLLSIGGNMLLPAKLGEAAKIIHLHNTSKMAWSAILGRVFWERFLDLNVLLILAMLVSFGSLPATTGTFVIAIATAFWATLVLVKIKPELLVKAARCLPGRHLTRFCVESIEHLQQTFRIQFIGRMAGCTLLVWIFYSGTIIVSVILLGLPLTWIQALVFFVATAGATAIPSVPGSIGVYEAAATAVFAWYGVPKEQALASAIVLHFLLFIPGLTGALILIARGKFRLADVRKTTLERKAPSV